MIICYLYFGMELAWAEHENQAWANTQANASLGRLVCNFKSIAGQIWVMFHTCSRLLPFYKRESYFSLPYYCLTFGDYIGPKKITEKSSYLLKIDE